MGGNGTKEEADEDTARRAPVPKVRVPAQARAGEIIEIKTLISHPMENGRRKDAAGRAVPRRILYSFTAAFNGRMVFRADWFPAVSANPYQSFFFKVTEPGEFTFAWKEEGGKEYTARAVLAVV